MRYLHDGPAHPHLPLRFASFPDPIPLLSLGLCHVVCPPDIVRFVTLFGPKENPLPEISRLASYSGPTLPFWGFAMWDLRQGAYRGLCTSVRVHLRLHGTNPMPEA